MEKFVIAVDGPAGSGKSTVAKRVAKKLKIVYVDTGAMYRSIAYYAMTKAVDLENESAISTLLKEIDLKIEPQDGGQRIFLNAIDITDKIRTQAIGQGASKVAIYKAVRDAMGQMQKEMADKFSLIMDGRDIGTYVLPTAEVKIYLDAKPEQRALRRMEELKEKGETFEFEKIKQEIILRDKTDMNREYRPLKQAEDAIYVDTSGMDIQEVVEKILKIVEEKLR